MFDREHEYANWYGSYNSPKDGVIKMKTVQKAFTCVRYGNEKYTTER